MYKDKIWFEKQVKDNLSVNELSNKCNVTTATIRNYEKKHNMKLRRDKRVYKGSVNANYFQSIVNEEQAYILGFILADGSIGSNGMNVDIVVNKHDIDILDKIKEATSLKNDIKDKKNGEQKRIYLCSKQMCDDLSNYGIKRNKVSSTIFPKLEDDLYKHFIRGVFDGDGHVGKRQSCLVTDSIDFLKDMIAYLENVFDKKFYTRQLPNGSYAIQFNRSDKDFMDYIYKNSNIYLDRKKKAYKTYWA